MSNYIQVSNSHLSSMSSSLSTLPADVATANFAATKKVFTSATDPTHTITDPVSHSFAVVGGVDASSGSLAKINPLKVSDSGALECSVSNQLTDHSTEATLLAMSAKLPTALDSSGDLKVSVQSGMPAAITGFGLESTQLAMSAKLPLALSASGHLKVAILEGGSGDTNASTENQGTAHAIGADSNSSIIMDCTNKGKIRLTVNSSSTDTLYVMGSDATDGTYVAFEAMFPSANVIGSDGTTVNMATLLIECPPSFIRLRNPTATSVTLNDYNFKTTNH